MSYRTRHYGSNERWLLKALREVAHEVEQLVSGLDDEQATRRLPDANSVEERSILDLVAYLRDVEREDLESVQAIVRSDGARLRRRRAEPGESDRELHAHDLPDLAWEFSMLREELLWTLQMADEGWRHVGRHPYRGEISLSELVHEINERDLETMWALRRLREAVRRAPVR